ncbi:MAG: flavoprotein [Acidobacteriota bacterium]
MKPKIAILGSGPTGLEAALAAAEGGYPFVLFEAGDGPAAAVRSWGHVRVFTPWDLNVSPRARKRLAAVGHEPPTGGACPTGDDLAAQVFDRLAALPEIAPCLRLGTRVLEVGRDGLVKSDEIGTGNRRQRPFRLLVRDADGGERIERADIVLDCTGTYGSPNRLGDGGIPAPGENAADGAIIRHLPKIDAGGWADRTVLLVGAGHSARTAARDLADLAQSHPETQVVWALRKTEPPTAPEEDELPERLALEQRAAELASGDSPAFDIRLGVVVEGLAPAGDRLRVTLRRRDGGTDSVVEVDRILSLTGYVGDYRLYRQLQVHECYATAGPMKLAAALLGAGGGDCLAQTSHGSESLVNPEPDFFLLGAKSYGRNTTFLMRTGWQQVDEVFGLLKEEGKAA